MKNDCLLQRTALAVLILGYSTVGMAQDWSSSIALALGQKQLKSRDWEQADEQDSIGLIMDFQRNNLPFSIAVDVLASGVDKSGSADPYEGYTAELHLGLRRSLALGNSGFQVYGGAGMALGHAEIELTNPLRSGDGRGVGYWAGAGLRYEISSRFSLGADLRQSAIDINGTATGGRQFSFTFIYTL
ncbi:MAG: porin family protein [Halieaceae bacterium]|uniref:outer membrane protein n=1 Tax=Haliea alexandrii TaxID=2448162 RepID=UPI001304F6F4|nr:outer membrane beta-barrel protein [Haliea alexandrii]MCR9185413.1 porin family protein [Halieaceae bacterium]